MERLDDLVIRIPAITDGRRSASGNDEIRYGFGSLVGLGVEKDLGLWPMLTTKLVKNMKDIGVLMSDELA